MSSRPNLWHLAPPAQARPRARQGPSRRGGPGTPEEALARPAQARQKALQTPNPPGSRYPLPVGASLAIFGAVSRGLWGRPKEGKTGPPPALPAAGVRSQGPPAGRGASERAAKEHRPRAAEVIGGGQTTHCLACGHRGELDPRVLAVVEGDTRTMAPSSAGSAATAAAHGSRGSGFRRRRG
jgi:hypothetical protein